jgi:hypothetical protein
MNNKIGYSVNDFVAAPVLWPHVIAGASLDIQLYVVNFVQTPVSINIKNSMLGVVRDYFKQNGL